MQITTQLKFLNNSMDIEKIKKIDWYRQETEGSPYFIYQPCIGCVDNFKKQHEIVWYCDLDSAQAFLSQDLLRLEAKKFLEKGKEEPGYFQSVFDGWDERVRVRNEKIYTEIESTDVSKADDKTLLRLNTALAEQTYNMWMEFYIDVYDLDSESLVEAELIEEGITLTDEERNTLMTQSQPIAHQRAERDLLSIVQLIKTTPGAVNTLNYISSPANLHRLRTYPEINQALQEYQQQYFWLNNSWGTTKILTTFDFVENIKQILAGTRDINAELQTLQSFSEYIQEQKKKIAEAHGMSDWLQQLFDFFGLLTYWRDERKVQVQKINHYLELLGREIAQRSNMTWEEIRIYDAKTIDAIPVNVDKLEEYRALFSSQPVMMWDGKKTAHLSSEDGKKVLETIEQTMHSDVSEIRGMIACPGKVKGEVVVINKRSEFDKMKKGAILVTVMTRPEFVPLMKQAAAVVTDEGGITSHAAVVSRELKVPCIIGTQIATKKLNDGDEVFVNADHGVVLTSQE